MMAGCVTRIWVGGDPVTHPPASFLEGPGQSLIIIHAGNSAKSTPRPLYIKILKVYFLF
jgi:hypothetical protein